MSDPSRYDDTGGTPRWVKIFGIIALVVALLVVVMLLIGGGGHSPQPHGGAGASPPSNVTASATVGGYTPPTGVPTP